MSHTSYHKSTSRWISRLPTVDSWVIKLRRILATT